MKQKLNIYLDSIENFDELNLKDQVKALCYFQAEKDNKEFSPSDITLLFEVGDLHKPSNISNYFLKFKKEKFLIQTKKGYKLNRTSLLINPLISKQRLAYKENPLSTEEKKHVESIALLDALDLHLEVIRVSRKLFIDKHYAQAIFEAFKSVNNKVKNKSEKSKLDGKNLMTTVFSKNNPILKINALATPTDEDEQEGYMHLFAGAMLGIRNPKAHENIIQNNPRTTIKLLCLASLLAQKADDATKA